MQHGSNSASSSPKSPKTPKSPKKQPPNQHLNSPADEKGHEVKGRAVRRALTSEDVAKAHCAAAIQALFRGSIQRKKLIADGIVSEKKNLKMIRAVYQGAKQRWVQKKKEMLRTTLCQSWKTPDETGVTLTLRSVANLIVETSEAKPLQRRQRAQVLDSLECDDLGLLEYYLLNVREEIDRRVEETKEFDAKCLPNVKALRSHVEEARQNTALANEARGQVISIIKDIEEQLQGLNEQGLKPLMDEFTKALKRAQRRGLELNTTLNACGLAGLEWRDKNLDPDVFKKEKPKKDLGPEGLPDVPEYEKELSWKRRDSVLHTVNGLTRWRPKGFDSIFDEANDMIRGTHPAIQGAAVLQALFRGVKTRCWLIRQGMITSYLRSVWSEDDIHKFCAASVSRTQLSQIYLNSTALFYATRDTDQQGKTGQFWNAHLESEVVHLENRMREADEVQENHRKKQASMEEALALVKSAVEAQISGEFNSESAAELLESLKSLAKDNPEFEGLVVKLEKSASNGHVTLNLDELQETLESCIREADKVQENLETGSNFDISTGSENDKAWLSLKLFESHINFQEGEEVEVVMGGNVTKLDWQKGTIVREAETSETLHCYDVILDDGSEEHAISNLRIRPNRPDDPRRRLRRGLNEPEPGTPSTASTAFGGHSSLRSAGGTVREHGSAWGSLFDGLPQEEPPLNRWIPDHPESTRALGRHHPRQQIIKRLLMSEKSATVDFSEVVPTAPSHELHSNSGAATGQSGQGDSKGGNAGSNASSRTPSPKPSAASSDATETEPSDSDSEDDHCRHHMDHQSVYGKGPVLPLCHQCGHNCSAKEVTAHLECSPMAPIFDDRSKVAACQWATEFEDLKLPPNPPISRFGVTPHPKFKHLKWHEYTKVEGWSQQLLKEARMGPIAASHGARAKTLSDQREDFALCTVFACCKRPAEERTISDVSFMLKYLKPVFKEFFRLVPPRIEDEICLKLTSTRFREGDTLWKPGDTPDGIYFVIRGQINIYNGNIVSGAPSDSVIYGGIVGGAEIFLGTLGSGTAELVGNTRKQFQFHDDAPRPRNSTALAGRKTDVLKLSLQPLDDISVCRQEIDEEETIEAMKRFMAPVQKNPQLIPKLLPCVSLQDFSHRRVLTTERCTRGLNKALIIFLVSGELNLKKRGTIVGNVGPGGFVGGEALYGKSYRYTTVSNGDARGLVLTAKDYLEHVEKRSDRTTLDGGGMYDDGDDGNGADTTKLVPADILKKKSEALKQQNDAKKLHEAEWKNIGHKAKFPMKKTPLSSCLPFVTPSASGAATGMPTDADLFPLAQRAYLLQNRHARGARSTVSVQGANGQKLLGRSSPPTASKLELQLSRGILDPMASKASLATLTTTANSASQASFARQRLLESFSSGTFGRSEEETSGSLGLGRHFHDIEAPSHVSPKGPSRGHTVLFACGSMGSSKPPVRRLKKYGI